MAKPLVEHQLAVSIKDLRAFGFLRPGWEEIGGRAHPIDGGGWLMLSWAPDGNAVEVQVQGLRETVRKDVQLDYTPCHFGGDRPWFRCPAHCGRRAGVLYVIGAELMCRRCAGCAYQTQGENALGRLIMKGQRIRRRLGGPPQLTAPIPAKPKWMRWKTYRQLCAHIEGNGATVLQGVTALLDRCPVVGRPRGPR